MCLYSQTHCLYSCDIWTTSEVSQPFQWINHGSRSSYLTFTVLAQYFVVLFFYLFGYLEEISNGLVYVQRALFSLSATSHLLSTRPGKLWNTAYDLPSCQSKKSTLLEVKWFIDSFHDNKARYFCVCAFSGSLCYTATIVTYTIFSIVLGNYSHNQYTFLGLRDCDFLPPLPWFTVPSH